MDAQTRLRTVLVVDDEPSMRELMRRFLMAAGYNTLEAPSGIKALEVVHQHEAPIDVLLTDIVMPNMDGFALASAVTSQHPETRVLFITGHANDHSDVENTLRWTPHAFLLKPFTSAALSRKMEYLLLARNGLAPSQPPTAARFMKAIPVLYLPSSQTAWLRGLTIDISYNGMQLEAVGVLDTGSRLDVSFDAPELFGSMPHGVVRRHSRVVRHATPTPSIPYPLGIQFASD